MEQATSGADRPYGYRYEEGRRAAARGRRRLALVAAAVVGVGATVFYQVSSTVRVGSVQGTAVAASTPECQAIHQQIAAHRSVDVAAAERCDQIEFAALENVRQAARARGEKPAMQISQTCTLVNERAAQGDATLDFTLAFDCRQRERFANTVNAQNGVGAAGKTTSLCRGAQVRQARGETVDAFTRTFCAQEAGGNSDGPGGGAPSKTPAPAASPKTTGAARTCTATFVNGGGITANGEQNDPKALTAGSNIFLFGTRVQVTNPDTGRSVTVRINDRNGVFCVAMSEAAFAQIRTPGKNLIRNAQVRVVG